MNFLKEYKHKSLQDINSIKSFSDSWPIWKENIDRYLQDQITPNSIINLGDSLRDIFFSTNTNEIENTNERGQSQLSTGGAAWESLVCWYLNFCLCNSRTVVIKFKNELVPDVVKDALAVSYSNFKTNTESDLIAITFPEEVNNLNQHFNRDNLNEICETYIEHLSICNIQCKTNWNDNAQIPMLWDIVYQTTEFSTHNISVGTNNRKLSHFKKFKYCFVTVPSQRDIEKFKTDSVAVKRVHNISGGNYWGLPSRNGIALSIKEMLTKIFDDSSNNNSIRLDLKEAIEQNLHDKFLR